MVGKVAIIGAGINGITNAIYLLEEGFAVTVFSKDDPLKTNSDAAVATWYAPDDSRPLLQEVCLNSVSKFHALSKSTHSGVDFIPIVHYYKDEDDFQKSVWSQKKLTDLIKTEDVSDHLPLGAPQYSNFKKAILTYTPLADVKVYRPFLLKQFAALGGKLEIKTITAFKELAKDYDLIINCTGWETKNLVKDEHVYPVRGQTEIFNLFFNAKPKVSLNVKDLNGYIVFRPKSKDCVVGTTYQEKEFDPKVREEDKKNIINKMMPFFSDLSLMKSTSKVGIRCGRTDVRIEYEKIEQAHVIHCYGHGGSGFSGSWGSAEKVFSCIKGLNLYPSLSYLQSL